MAAYAALVSVRHIVEQIQEHPFPPISLDEEQVESLTEKVSFLQEFLEGYSHVAGYTSEADALECRIADAAYAAEDVIESHIVDQILAESTRSGEKVCSMEFYQGLQKVIEDLDLIKNEAMEIKLEKMGIQDQLLINSSGSLGSASTWQKNSTMVGFDDEEYKIRDMLTRGQRNQVIITIVGMGGIGKTTLARNIYKNQVVVEHFDIRVWVTISQEYKTREILSQLLQEEGKGCSQMDEYELGEKLHKRLSGRRYLIIIDDIWDVELWDQLKLYFPDNNNGSGIMLTTRLDKLIPEQAGSYYIQLDFLDEDDSWDLFCDCVFGEEEECPPELEDIGDQIAQGCQGLPLSIVVIGGLLAKSEKTPQQWEYIAENLNSIVNLEENERCIQLLYLSYRNLPVYLKPCFLYMGVFREDDEIRASKLVKLWVAEGFLKPIDGKSLEEVAEEYLEELVGRHLIFVEEDDLEKVKICRIHDLLRDLCLREARKQKFFCVLDEHSLEIPQDLNTERRVCIHQHRLREEYPPQFLDALESASSSRSLIWDSEEPNYIPSISFRLLRVSSVVNESVTGDAHLEAILQQVNLRFLFVDFFAYYDVTSHRYIFPSLVSLLWNLQTLIVRNTSIISAPSEIWRMPQLRHVMSTELELPNPPSDQVDIVLENLQTLSYIHNFKCSEEVVKRIPNITKLKVCYEEEHNESLYLVNNLSHLQKLESLHLHVHRSSDPENMQNHLMQNLNLPHSLKKLTLFSTHLHWEDLTTKIGLLPLLVVLKLRHDALIGPEWETSEGQFRSLKVLLIEDCDLECWTTDDTHFPRLELLYLHFLEKLWEIPLSIGNIPTLELIELGGCGDSVIDSAKRIQEELGYEDLQVVISNEYMKIGGHIINKYRGGHHVFRK